MPDPVLTPITQAMKEGALTRQELKSLMQRSDRPALVHLGIFIAVLGCTGGLIFLASGTWWLLPAMILHGVVLVHLFALQHECVHYTAFRTRRLNDIFGNLCGFAIFLPHQFFRYEHCDHHTYTQIHGRDPELIVLPISLKRYLWYVSSIPFWSQKFKEVGLHACGRVSLAEEAFVPRDVRKTIVLEARMMLLAYSSLAVLCMLTGWQGPIWYWWLPLLLGEPLMRMIRMSEHVGRPNNRDMTVNTRTNIVSLPWRFLAWNMNYHAEHHYASSVPFHALPRLHRKLTGFIHVEQRGYLGAHIDILTQIFHPRLRLGTVPDKR